jgi:hypothetical protein
MFAMNLRVKEWRQNKRSELGHPRLAALNF